VKILIDMCLSPEWRATLSAAGFEAVHWSEIGDGNAPDRALFDWAATQGFVIFTHDLDFGTLLALSKTRRPSVIQIRSQEIMPEVMGQVVVSALTELQAELSAGALVTIDAEKRRARILPL
jgi:predicted nuclease of predicted toxin-antitoxin system